MSINLKFKICESSNSSSIYFTDQTGSYDAVDNAAGWGAPNEETTDVITATLILKSPSGVLYPSVDMNALGFPRTNTTAKNIKATDIDSGLSLFEDGFWTVTYTVTTLTGTYTQTQSFFFYSQSKKEVCSLISKMHIDDCSCSSEEVTQALQMNAYLTAIGYSVSLGDIASTLRIFEALKNLIKCSICK